MNIFNQILDVKRREMEGSQLEVDVIEKRHNIRSLRGALQSPDISVIAEIKMKSPSEGDILPTADPIQIAKDYESAGAAAISVLTDEQFFGGSLDILKDVCQAVSIPVLRKDFIISAHQIMDAASVKADAFLLIAEALTGHEMKKLSNIGNKLGLESLVEFHSAENAAWIMELNPSIVGVNCRDLETMTTNFAYFKKIFNSLPKDSIKVAESGIRTSVELQYVADLGYHAALVGTSLMKTGNPGKALEQLLGGLK